MKVTKFIREYVVSEVSKVYDAIPNPYEEADRVLKEELETLCEQLGHEAGVKLAEFMNQNEITRCDGSKYSADDFGVRAPIPRYPNEKDRRKFAENLRAKKEDKIRDILITLELGATKDDLVNLIEQMKAEV